MVAGDEAGAWAVLEAALASGVAPADAHMDLLVPALDSIGEQWARGVLTVADEHRASVVAQRLIGRLGPQFAAPRSQAWDGRAGHGSGGTAQPSGRDTR